MEILVITKKKKTMEETKFKKKVMLFESKVLIGTTRTKMKMGM